MSDPLGYGPIPSTILLLGDSFTKWDEAAQQPFTGKTRTVLESLFREAGLNLSACYQTCVLNFYPGIDSSPHIAQKKKDIQHNWILYNGLYISPRAHLSITRLQWEIDQIKPNLIIAMGELALWALTGASGIYKWRGSLLGGNAIPKIIPTLPPTAIYGTQWSSNSAPKKENRTLILADLRRAAEHQSSHSYNRTPWNFRIRPSFSTAMTTLRDLETALADHAATSLPFWIDLDLETRAGHIACCGLSWSFTDSICIPFMDTTNPTGYWSLEEETSIVFTLFHLLTSPSLSIRWQNGLYDAQYIYRHWHFIPHGVQDTMLSHHNCFAGLPKSLAFQASLYCHDYIYWKDDGKTWAKNVGEDQLWSYNCEDTVRTRECGEVSTRLVAKMGLTEVESFQQKLFYPVLQAMIKGVKIDLAYRDHLALELEFASLIRHHDCESVLGHPLNFASSKQMIEFFYTDCGLTPITTRPKKGKPGHVTCDDVALDTISKREPLLAPIISLIRDTRSIDVFHHTFINASLDSDSRMRCSYNICGTETYRLSSSVNAFETGTNLQNIPKGSEDDSSLSFPLPNIRKLFIPDEFCTFFDIDLDRADLQVVVWESGEEELKHMLRLGVDLHIKNGADLDNISIPFDELIESHPNYPEHKARYKKQRQFAKAFIHGTNYGGSARTMSVAANCTVHQAEKMQKRWFDIYPGIKRWHAQIQNELNTNATVRNKFGYQRYYFGGVDNILPDALAWIPQSTVACVINRAWLRLYESAPDIQVLLQVHDSLAGQFPTIKKEQCMKQLLELSRITVPYNDPLIIPTGIKTSEKSWGDCK